MGEIGDAKRTGCMTDPNYDKLQGSTFIEELFSKGIALYVSFSISALFVATFFLVNFKKVGFNNTQQPSTLQLSNQGNYTRKSCGHYDASTDSNEVGLGGVQFR